MRHKWIKLETSKFIYSQKIGMESRPLHFQRCKISRFVCLSKKDSNQHWQAGSGIKSIFTSAIGHIDFDMGDFNKSICPRGRKLL